MGVASNTQKYASAVHAGESEGKKIWAVRKRLRTRIQAVEMQMAMVPILILCPSLCWKMPSEEHQRWKMATTVMKATLRKSCMIRLALRRARPDLTEPSEALGPKKEEVP
jgi:hypothetical protein